MKKLCFIAVCSLALSALTKAQTGSAGSSVNSPIDFASTSAAHISLFEPQPRALFATPGASPAANGISSLGSLSVPPPSPSPSPVPGAYEVNRWQLAVGVAWERFQSDVFNASAVGISTTVSYFFSDWLGLDGQVSATFAPSILRNEHIKLVNYAAGPRIAWRGRQWEPFAHVLGGGAHALPQTAGNSQSSYLLQAGGGTDYRLWPALSLRAEADYLRTGFFGSSQNNFYLSAGVVFNF